MLQQKVGWMLFVILLASSGLLGLLQVRALGATPLGQAPSPPALLEASAAATEGVQAMRFAMEIGTELSGATGWGEGMPTLRGWGAFQAPDRVQATSQAGPSGPQVEVILIGQIWGRRDEGPWQSGGPGSVFAGGPVTPSVLAATLRDLPPYLLTPSVREEATAYVLTASLDVAGLGADPDTSWRSGGVPFVGGSGGSLELTQSDVLLRIDRTTRYVQEIQLSSRLQLSPPTPPEGILPEGFPTEGFPPSEMQVTTQLTLSDYNDPNIQITPPR